MIHAPRRNTFVLILSLTMLAVVAVGFAPTFYLRSAFGTLDRWTGNANLLPHLVIHGVFLTAWFSLFALQISLVRAGRTHLHRQLGVIGLVIAIGVVASSALTMHRGRPRIIAAMTQSGAGFDAARQSIVLKRGVEVVVHDFWTLVGFVLLVGVAVYLRAKPIAHKRLMILASALLIGPALSTVRPIGRALAPYLPDGFGPSKVFLLLCIVALACHDFATNRRIEPATLWGSAIVAAVVVMSEIMLPGDSGAALVRWITGLSL